MYTFRGKRGIQGNTGPTGSSDFALVPYVFEASGGVTSKAVEVFDSAPRSGTLVFFGYISYTASALNTTTITPEIAGVPTTTGISYATTPISQKDTIATCGSGAITAGDTFIVNVVVTGGGNVSLDYGYLLYAIQ